MNDQGKPGLGLAPTEPALIDFAGFRHNVAIVVMNRRGQVLLAKRRGMDAWQLPQGGIHQHETVEQAMFRELQEEIGLHPDDVRVLARSRGWLRYKLPARLRRPTLPKCIGQKQVWFLLEFLGDDAQISLNEGVPPEFDGWEWVGYWYPLTRVVDFKRDVYAKGLRELLFAWHSAAHKQ